MAKSKKKEARSRIARLIATLSHEQRAEKGRAACAHLLELPELQGVQAVLLYAPLADELDVWPAIRALAADGKRIIMPKCLPRTRELVCIEVENLARDLRSGMFGILEPTSGNQVDVLELDFVVVPGRAFDRAGNRLGRGRGYYDGLLARLLPQAFTCGIAFDCQIVPSVPTTPRDIPVAAVVTESGLLRKRE